MGKPDVIGPYKILSELGRGSFSKVYKAQDTRDETIWAIKIVKKKLLTDATRTDREISILQTLRHPNIVRLKEVLRDDDKLFLVMEYLQGDLL